MEEIITGVITILTLILTCILSAYKIISNIGEQKNKKREQLYEQLLEEMKKVEEENYTSEEKLRKVMERLKEYAKREKIPTDPEDIIKKIEEMIEFTKKINRK